MSTTIWEMTRSHWSEMKEFAQRNGPHRSSFSDVAHRTESLKNFLSHPGTKAMVQATHDELGRAKNVRLSSEIVSQHAFGGRFLKPL